MIVEKTTLDRVLLIKPEPLNAGRGDFFEDFRGMFLEIYNKDKLKAVGIDIDFPEDDISFSKKNVLRGMHGDTRTWKLITCTRGKIFFVALNGDEQSSSFGKWQSFDLNPDNKWRVLVPPLYASGYVALEDDTMVQYKQSSLYIPGGQFSYKWNDPRFGIDWPIKDPILSTRDAG